MKPNGDKLTKMLNEHSAWVLSLGKTGRLADCESWNLDTANLEMANLPFAKFHFASLRNANLSGVNFRQAELFKINLINANLDGADLEGANFKRAKIEAANFSGANLDKANFEQTNLSVYNLAEYKPESDFKDTGISEPLPNEKTSPESVKKNHKLDKATLNRGSNIKSTKEDLFVDSNSKAINPDMIDEAVIDMVEKVKSNIHLDLVKAICKHKHGIEKIDKIDFENGDIVTHNDRVAFKLDFKISYNLSLLIDRKGNFLS